MIIRIISYLSFFALSSNVAIAASMAENNRKLFSVMEFLRDPFAQETARFDTSQHRHRRRALQESPACGDQITTITAGEIQQIATLLLGTVLVGDLAAFGDVALAAIDQAIKYDLRAVKICSSCIETNILTAAESWRSAEGFGSYNTYCNESFFGFDAQHSSVMFLPLESETGLPIRGKLRGVMAMHGLLFENGDSPSEILPTNLTQALVATGPEVFFLAITDFLESLVASSSGAVSLIPDFLGYGETVSTHNRTSYLPEFYMQSAAQAYFGAQSYLNQSTNGCTQLENVWSVVGSSDGAFGSIPTAKALQALDNRILNVFAGAPYLDTNIQLRFVFDTYISGSFSLDKNNALLQLFVPYLGFVGSIESPGYPNTGTGQIFINASQFDAVTEWMANPSPFDRVELNAVVPFPALDILNEDLVEMYQTAIATNVTNPCVEGLVSNKTDKLCAVINQGSLLSVLQSFDIQTQLCYSQGDTINTPDNFIPEIFENSLVSKATSLLNGILPITGDHAEAVFLCKINPISYFAITGPSSADPPALVTPLEGDKSASCQNGMVSPTTVPFTNPTIAPSNDSPRAPTLVPVPGRSSSTIKKGLSFVSFVIGAWIISI